MYPWSAFGHMIPCLHLSNELTERGHNITFILPKKVQSQLQHLNLHPTLISFHPLTIPHVDGLLPGAETASDVPISLHHLLATAMDRTTDQVEAALRALKPDFLFYDMAYWAPLLASKLGMKSIFYSAVSAATLVYFLEAQQISKSRPIPTGPPPGYPSSTVVLRPHEARLLQFLFFPFGECRDPSPLVPRGTHFLMTLSTYSHPDFPKSTRGALLLSGLPQGEAHDTRKYHIRTTDMSYPDMFVRIID